jgi:predicted nucleic acid-binding protein
MTLFVDSSSLLKLYVPESGSELVRTLVSKADLVATAALSYTEIRATLARLQRDKRLTAAQFRETKRRFDSEWPALLSVTVTDDLTRTAGDLAEGHALRSSDAIQLAAFVQLLQGSDDEDVEFSSFDERLTRAAKSLG